jgi:hypothetical protein
MDLLGNYAYRYSQMDGTLALPFKSDGRYHFEGNVHMLTLANLKLAIENLKPAPREVQLPPSVLATASASSAQPLLFFQRSLH